VCPMPALATVFPPGKLSVLGLYGDLLVADPWL